MKPLLLASIISTAIALQANAATVLFDLIGTAGPGLHFLNEPAVASGGTGGEIGTGITYDDVSNLLTVSNVGWGSSQGFTDLSSLANNSHIHVTANNFGNGGAGNFTQTGGVAFTLTRSSSAVTGGTFTNTPILLSAAQETDLLNGKYYINIHTLNNGGGELRGFLVAVPEPSRAAFAIFGLSILALRRRR
jgi:CHRD domain